MKTHIARLLAVAVLDEEDRMMCHTDEPLFDRGYTMHEHYDAFGLINMNGRVYDPLVGRMLSPDILIQDPELSQAYNRYSYCLNNPLRFTDPSGYIVCDTNTVENSPLITNLNGFVTDKPWLFDNCAQYNTDESSGNDTYQWANRFISYFIGKEKEKANYYFPKGNEVLDFMYENSFDDRMNAYKELSAWEVENGVIVQPWSDNDERTSYNRAQKGDDSELYYDFMGKKYLIKSQIHTHPNYDNGDVGVSQDDKEMDKKIPVYIIYNSSLYKVGDSTIRLEQIRNINNRNWGDYFK